jgi:hypothetical protein
MMKHSSWLILRLRNKLLGINKGESKMILIDSICMSFLIEQTDMAGDAMDNL